MDINADLNTQQNVAVEQVGEQSSLQQCNQQETIPIIDGQSPGHANPNYSIELGKHQERQQQTSDPILESEESPFLLSSSSPNELDRTFSVTDKSCNSSNNSGASMDLTFSLCEEGDEEEDDEEDEDDDEGAEYDISTGSRTTIGRRGNHNNSPSSSSDNTTSPNDFNSSSVLLQNMNEHSEGYDDDIQFFPGINRSLRLQPQFQFHHQDQLGDPSNFQFGPNLSCFDAAGLVSFSGSGGNNSAGGFNSGNNSYSLISGAGDSTSGDINNGFSESPFVFPDNVMEYGEPQFFPGNCVGYLETILEEDDEEIEEEEGCSGRHWWTADSDTDTDSVIRVDNQHGLTQPNPANTTTATHSFHTASSLSLPLLTSDGQSNKKSEDNKHHFRSSASSKPFELEDLHLFDQLDHAFEETLSSETRKRSSFGFELNLAAAAKAGEIPNNVADAFMKGCQKSLSNTSQNNEKRLDQGVTTAVGNNEEMLETMLTKENVKAHSAVENSNIIYEVGARDEQEKDHTNGKRLGNAESRETFGSSLSPSSSGSDSPPEVAEEDFFYSSPGSEEEECRSIQEEEETDSCSSDDSEKKGVVLAEFSLGSASNGGSNGGGGMLFGNNRNRRSFEAPSRLKSFRSFDSLNCLAGTELLFSKPETFPSIDHIKEVSEPSSESESSNDRNLILEEDEEDISEEDNSKKDNKNGAGGASGNENITLSPSSSPSSTELNSKVICNKSNSNSSPSLAIPTASTTASCPNGSGLRSTENLSEDSGIGNESNDGISNTAASTPGAFIEESNVIMAVAAAAEVMGSKSSNEMLHNRTSSAIASSIHDEDKSSLVSTSSLESTCAKDYISSAEFALNPFVYSSLSSSEPESSSASLTYSNGGGIMSGAVTETNGNGSPLHSINKINAISNTNCSNEQSLIQQTHLNGKSSSTSSPDYNNAKVQNSSSTKNGSSQLAAFDTEDKHSNSNDKNNLLDEGQPLIISNCAAIAMGKTQGNIDELSINKLNLTENNDKEMCMKKAKNGSSSSSAKALSSLLSTKLDCEEEHSSSSSYSSSSSGSGDEQTIPMKFHRQRSDSESEYELAENALQKDNEKEAYDIIVNSPSKKKKDGNEKSSSSTTSSSSTPSSSLSSSSLAHEQLSSVTTTSTSAPTAILLNHEENESNGNKCNERNGPVSSSSLSSSSLINIHRNGCGSSGVDVDVVDDQVNMQRALGSSEGEKNERVNTNMTTVGMRNERLPLFESSIDGDDDEGDHGSVAKTLPITENNRKRGATSRSNNNKAMMGVSVNLSTSPSQIDIDIMNREKKTIKHEDGSNNMKGLCKNSKAKANAVEDDVDANRTRLLHQQLPPVCNKEVGYKNSDELTTAAIELPNQQHHEKQKSTEQFHRGKNNSGSSSDGGSGGGGAGSGELLSFPNTKQNKKLSGQVETQQQQQKAGQNQQQQNNIHNIHQHHHKGEDEENSLRSVELDESTSADVAHNKNCLSNKGFHPAVPNSVNQHNPGQYYKNSSGNPSGGNASEKLLREENSAEEFVSEEEDESNCPNQQLDTVVVKKFLASFASPNSELFFNPIHSHHPHQPFETVEPCVVTAGVDRIDSDTRRLQAGVVADPYLKHQQSKNKQAQVILDHSWQTQSVKNPCEKDVSKLDEEFYAGEQYGFPCVSSSFTQHPNIKGEELGKDLIHSVERNVVPNKLIQPLKENNTFCPSFSTSPPSLQKALPNPNPTQQYYNDNSECVKKRPISPSSVNPTSFPTSKESTLESASKSFQSSSSSTLCKDNNIYTGIDKFSVGLCAIKAAVVAVAPTIPSYVCEKSSKNSDATLSTPSEEASFPRDSSLTAAAINSSCKKGINNNGSCKKEDVDERTRKNREQTVPDILNLGNIKNSEVSLDGKNSCSGVIVMMEDSISRSDSPSTTGGGMMAPLKTKKYGPRNEVEVVVVSSRTPSPAPASSFAGSSGSCIKKGTTEQEPVYFSDIATRESSIPPPPLSPPSSTNPTAASSNNGKANRSRVHFSPVVSEISWRESYIDQSSECSGSTEDLLAKLENLDGTPQGRHHQRHHKSDNCGVGESVNLGDSSDVVDVASSKVRPLQVVYDNNQIMATRADSPSTLVNSRGMSPSGRGPILVEKVEMTSSLLHDPEEETKKKGNNRHVLLGESQPSRKLVDVDVEANNEFEERVTDLVDFRSDRNNDGGANNVEERSKDNGTLGVYEDVEVQIQPAAKSQAISTTLSMVPDLLSQCEQQQTLMGTTLTHIDVKIEETIPDSVNTKNIVLNIGQPQAQTQPQKKSGKPQQRELSPVNNVAAASAVGTSPEPKQILPKRFAEDSKADNKRNSSSSAVSSSKKKSSKGFSIQGLGSSAKKSSDKAEKESAGAVVGLNGNGSNRTVTINEESKQENGAGDASKENKKGSKPGFFERLSKIRLSSGGKNKNKQKVHPKSGEAVVDPQGLTPVNNGSNGNTITGSGAVPTGRPLRSANSLNVKSGSGANNMASSSSSSNNVQPILKKSAASASSTSTIPPGMPNYNNGNEMSLIGDSENEPDEAAQAFENILEEIAGLKSIQLRQEKTSNSSIDKQSPSSQQVRSFAKRKQFYTSATSPQSSTSPLPPVSPTSSSNSRSCVDLDSKLSQFKEEASRNLDAISKSHPDLESIEDAVKMRQQQRQKSLSPEPPKDHYGIMDSAVAANRRELSATLPKSSRNPNSFSQTNESEREWYRLLKSATEKYAYQSKGPREYYQASPADAPYKSTGIVETDLDTGASREMLDEDMLQLEHHHHHKVPSCYTTMSTSEIPTSVAVASVSSMGGTGGGATGSPATAAKTRSLTNLSSRLPLSIAPNQFDESTGDLSDSEERAKSLEFLLDDNHKSSSVPPENKLRQLETRQLSEHELRIQRSLQRLNVPEWYKQHGTLSSNGPTINGTSSATTSASTPQNKSATLSILKRSEYGSSGGLAGGWSGLSTYKAPSMSSLQSSNGGRSTGTFTKSNFVRGRPATMSVTRTSKESLLTGSTGHSPSPFERSSFTYGMPFTMTRFGQGRLSTHSNSVSPPSTPDSSTKLTSTYVKKPYLGWRSQEKLNAAAAASGGTNSTGGTAAGPPKLSIYLPPAERLAADLLAARAKSPVRPPVSDRPPLPKAPPRSDKTSLSNKKNEVQQQHQGNVELDNGGALPSSQVINKNQTSVAVVTKLPQQHQQNNSIPPLEVTKNGTSHHHSKANNSDVHDSIRQVTTAIGHFVNRDQQQESHSTQQRTKPKVPKKKAIWIESSFVGQKPSSNK